MKATWHIAQQWCELGRVVRCAGWGMAVEHGSLTEKTSSAHSSLLSAEALLRCWCLDASPLFREEKGLSACLSRTFEWVMITCVELTVCVFVRESVSLWVMYNMDQEIWRGVLFVRWRTQRCRCVSVGFTLNQPPSPTHGVHKEKQCSLHEF